MSKICINCGVEKELSGFNLAKGKPRGRCKTCRSIENRMYYQNDDVKRAKAIYKNKIKEDNCFKFLCGRKKTDSKVKGIDFNLTEEYLRSIWSGVCPVFNITLLPLDVKITRNRPIDSAQLDRIDPTKGYIIGNVRFLSFRANRLKDNGTLEEFEQIVKFLKEVKNE